MYLYLKAMVVVVGEDVWEMEVAMILIRKKDMEEARREPEPEQRMRVLEEAHQHTVSETVTEMEEDMVAARMKLKPEPRMRVLEEALQHIVPETRRTLNLVVVV